MKSNRDVEDRLRAGHAGNVIEVGVGEKYVLHRQLVCANRVQKGIRFVARIDQDSGTGLRTADDEAVLVERWNGPDLDDHL